MTELVEKYFHFQHYHYRQLIVGLCICLSILTTSVSKLICLDKFVFNVITGMFIFSLTFYILFLFLSVFYFVVSSFLPPFVYLNIFF